MAFINFVAWFILLMFIYYLLIGIMRSRPDKHIHHHHNTYIDNREIHLHNQRSFKDITDDYDDYDEIDSPNFKKLNH